MSDVENIQEIEKIIISPEDELVDILKEVEKTRAKRIILTFAEPSDLLISPINLKVIQDSADDLKKPLISLIVQNTTGVRNAREAGMTVTESSGSIIDTFWEQAESTMNERIREKHETLKRSSVPQRTKIEEVEETRTTHDRNEFKKTIDDALEKSKIELEKKSRVIEENGIKLALDQEFEEEKGPSLLGKNFTKPEPEKKSSKKGFALPKFNFPKLSLPKSTGGMILRIVVPLLLLFVLAGYIAYVSMPLVRIKIFVESKGVSIDKVFSGDLKTATFDIEKAVVPVKKEESNKSASNSTKATGTAYKGTKAEGVVTLSYWNYFINGSKVLSIKAGTVLTNTEGLKFELTSNVELGEGGDTVMDAPLRALSVGEEYNLAKGQYFEIQGVPKEDASGSNNMSAFEGGSKTPYTVLSKGDVDKVVNDLKKNLAKEAESELTEKNDGTWELVPGSLKSEVDGDPATDVPVGAEADTVNITIKIKATALYYQKNSIDGAIGSLLTKAADDKNLFEGSTSEQLVLEENITKSIEVTEVKKDTIKVTVKASSNIQPEINKNEVVDKLKGKRWTQGKEVVQALKYTDKENEIQFSPDFFPDWLKYFPSRQGRIIVVLEEIVKE